jgi:CheY-like chemotaxis protein
VARASKRIVLVVEDDDETRDAVTATLESEGYRTVTASDGQDALAVLGQVRPHVVLLDLMMPIVSGWEVLGAIQTNPLLASLPVIVVSAYVDQAPGGVARVIRKPFRSEDLLSAVAAAAQQ